MKNEIRIATRQSPLALTQAESIGHLLQKNFPQLTVSYVKIITSGDLFLDKSLASVGGKGLFVKEIDDALLQMRADLAVHSLKDVPYALPQGLSLVAFPQRENPCDSFLLNTKWAGFMSGSVQDTLKKLPSGFSVGTTSLRRRTQLLSLRPDVVLRDLRGNIQTRIGKMTDFDAIVLAAAGLNRMGIDQVARIDFSPEEMLPAPGQGILAIETRIDDAETRAMCETLNHGATRATATCERAFLARLKADCHVPVAGFAQIIGQEMVMRGAVFSLDGQQGVRSEGRAALNEAQDLGEHVAEELFAKGAKQWLAG